MADPLIEATREGNAQKVKELLEAGANVFTTDGYGKSLLECAALNDDLEVFDILWNAMAGLNFSKLSNFPCQLLLVLEMSRRR